MKKIILSAIFAVFALVANAQRLSGGIEAGVSLSHPTGSDANKVGFNVGVFGELSLTRGWYLDAALKLSLDPWTRKWEYSNLQGTSSYGTTQIKNSATPYSLLLPIHAGYRFGVSDKASLFVAAGPYVGVGLWGDQKTSLSVIGNNGDAVKKESDTYSVFGDDGSMRRFKVGLDARIGAEFARHYIVSLGYSVQFNDFSEISGVSMHGQTFSLNIGYRF